jgi:hypothetical protein
MKEERKEEKEEFVPECFHNFIYSHKEQEIASGGANWIDVDVVICNKCGLVKLIRRK